jgi:hypothetical protein
MSQIRTLFDSARALNRPIEKVITYLNRSEQQLRTEISEYIATEHIEENFDRLLKLMQAALGGGGGHEIGVWVSGFYGSGKSSFTKYLGFGLDRQMKLGGDSFLHLLQNQLRTPQTRALFNQVSTTYDPVVVFLDLASEMLAGASMEDISTVLYLKVLQWAGYSEDLKVAELERMLEMDGKLVAFQKRASDELDGISWQEVHNQPLVANQIASRLASEFYPKLFPGAEEFNKIALHVAKSEIKRTEEMIDLIRRKSGKKNIVFIVDEVGQYVSAKSSLILNLDGLAKNLKQIGGGQVWLFATAQQTLTEDNPSATLNAPSLYKLKDRFPIQIHLEASDIKEICHRRLLSKSSAGEQVLGKLFDDFGASLRTATQLNNAGVYEVPLDRKTFIDLYPFLPAHFEMLLQLLGRLARKTGGLGLRSAIKVLQDVLVDRGGRPQSETTLADAPIKTLANTVTFYDSLRRDIQTSYSYIIEGVERVAQRFPTNKLAHDVAKSIAVLQILENLPVTAHNIAALLQPSVDSPSLKDNVESMIKSLLADGLIPLGEKNGSLRFLTQVAITLQKEFDQIEYRNADVRAEQNGSLRMLLKPLPSARVSGTRPVTAGLRAAVSGGQFIALEGEKEPIQLHVEFTPASNHEATRTERENDSRSSKERTSIFVLGRTDPEFERLAVTLVRCRKFVDQHRNAADPETQDFVRIVSERLERTSGELESKLQSSLLAGSFIAHGAHQPVAELGTELGEAAKAFLGNVAGRVFDRYSEAPIQAETALAEKFLKTPLDRITNADDPLQLIGRSGGKTHIKTDHKAIVSITDYLGQNTQVEGRRLLEHFNDPPFGWSKDTTRYLLAAAFLGGEIKLRIAGKDQVVKNDDTLTALGSNRALGPIGISLRDEKPPPEALDRASERLRELTGENVLPLEDEIATAAKKHFSGFQQAFASLAVELNNLDLRGVNRAEDLTNDLTAVVSGDGSDAIGRLGGVDSPLFDSLKWARKLKKALDNGLRVTISHLQALRRDIAALPSSGVPGELKSSAVDRLAEIDDILQKDAFFDESATLGAASTELDKLVASTVESLTKQQDELAETELARWQTLLDWQDLLPDDKNWINSEVEKLAMQTSQDLSGLNRLLAHDYDLNFRLRELEKQVATRADQSRKAREQVPPGVTGGPAEERLEPADLTIAVPPVLESVEQLEGLIKQLQQLRARLIARQPVRITWKQID